MENRTFENATDAAVNLTHLAHEVGKAKVLVNDVIQDGKHKVERTFKRGLVAAEDCIEDTTYFIKRHPWQSVGVAIGVGAVVGLLAGWQAGRGCERRQAC
jgi:ElaB/YqjD/DUF883 family membrane-anchored ribosome-binding protein